MQLIRVRFIPSSGTFYHFPAGLGEYGTPPLPTFDVTCQDDILWMSTCVSVSFHIKLREKNVIFINDEWHRDVATSCPIQRALFEVSATMTSPLVRNFPLLTV